MYRAGRLPGIGGVRRTMGSSPRSIIVVTVAGAMPTNSAKREGRRSGTGSFSKRLLTFCLSMLFIAVTLYMPFEVIIEKRSM